MTNLLGTATLGGGITGSKGDDNFITGTLLIAVLP